jgi:hypothetical protein
LLRLCLSLSVWLPLRLCLLLKLRLKLRLNMSLSRCSLFFAWFVHRKSCRASSSACWTTWAIPMAAAPAPAVLFSKLWILFKRVSISGRLGWGHWPPLQAGDFTTDRLLDLGLQAGGG